MDEKMDEKMSEKERTEERFTTPMNPSSVHLLVSISINVLYRVTDS